MNSITETTLTHPEEDNRANNPINFKSMYICYVYLQVTIILPPTKITVGCAPVDCID